METFTTLLNIALYVCVCSFALATRTQGMVESTAVSKSDAKINHFAHTDCEESADYITILPPETGGLASIRTLIGSVIAIFMIAAVTLYVTTLVSHLEAAAASQTPRASFLGHKKMTEHFLPESKGPEEARIWKLDVVSKLPGIAQTRQKRYIHKSSEAGKLGKELFVENKRDTGASSQKKQQNTSHKEFTVGPGIAKKAARLSGIFIPESYSLILKSYFPPNGDKTNGTVPSAKDFTFEASLEVVFECLNSTKQLVLHSFELNYTGNVTLEELSGGSNFYCIRETRVVPKDKIVIFELSHDLKKQTRYRFRVDLVGPIRNDLVGYYRSSYKENGQQRWLAVTQLAADAARRAFPCFDEPEYKATFKLTLEHASYLKALSNNKKIQTAPGSSKTFVKTSFELSPVMSTYLTAFALVDYDMIQSQTVSGNVTFGAWTRPLVIKSARYASEIGPKLLTYFEDYLNMPYVMEKVDQIAIPDFKFGAMENWGMITYEESNMLYDNETNTLSEKYEVAFVIGHELAHQWFGNLVTMKWWENTWLKEGFATLLPYIAFETLDPAGYFVRSMKELKKTIDKPLLDFY